MSYRTYSFITKNEVNSESLKEDIAKNFPFHLVREILRHFAEWFVRLIILIEN